MRYFLSPIILAGTLLWVSACQVQKPQDLPLAPSLDSSAWEVSEWISASDAPVATGQVYKSAPGSSWFLGRVTNARKVKKAIWMTTALGVFDIYLNGELVGKEVLKPGFTHYAKTKYAFTYDITPAFKKGAGDVNELSAQVTPGWWADKIITPDDDGRDGFIGKKCAFRGVLELVYADGTTERLGTDTEHWKAGVAGPVKHSGIFDGEEYDARELPGFLAPEKLSTPEVNTEFAGEILPTCGAEIYHREDLRLHPVAMYAWEGVTGAVESENEDEVEYGVVDIKRSYKDGDVVELNPGETLVVDFGQNAAAVPSFEFMAEEGTRLECLPSEILNDGNGAERRDMDGPEGSIHRRNLRVDHGEIWLTYVFGDCKGKYVKFQPRASFWGYRYVSITADKPVKFASIASVPVTSITQEMETGRMVTGDESINKLISNTVWGMRSNYLSVPTDCPQRNERLGWMADTHIFAETGSFFASTGNFFHKWTRDVRDSQVETGGFPSVAPFAQYGNETMRLGWADAGVIVPWTVWKQFGDASIIEENWDAMALFMEHVNATRYEHSLLREENDDFNYADWVSYEPLETCSGIAFKDDATSAQAELYWSYLGGCYWAVDAAMMADMATASGRDAAPYLKMEKDAKEYLKATYLLPDGSFRLRILNPMQTPALFALKLGLVSGEEKDAMCRRLRENFAAHGGCLQTGFLGTGILMQTLTDNGMADIAWDLLFQRRNPSWLYSVDNGATTIWERWNSYMVDKGMGPNGMNSFNHYAYGCVCQWLWESAAGISADTSAPGFTHIVMKPLPDKRLGSLDAEYKSAAGTIKSAWKYEGDVCTWTFTIPEGASATVVLPSGEKDYSAGTYTVEYK